jgi:hypothetical protein
MMSQTLIFWNRENYKIRPTNPFSKKRNDNNKTTRTKKRKKANKIPHQDLKE